MAKIFISRRSQPGGGGVGGQACRAGDSRPLCAVPVRLGGGEGGKPGESGKAEGGQQATS